MRQSTAELRRRPGPAAPSLHVASSADDSRAADGALGAQTALAARANEEPVRGALPRFILLYVVMYAAYGVASPFFPAFLAARGVTAGQLGILLGAATAIRLVSAPLAARAGDALGRRRGVLVVTTLAAALVTLGLLPSKGLWPVFAVTLAHAAALAPMNVLADALALTHARPTKARGFEYGWVRGAGSAAFVGGMLASGQLVGALGLDVTVKLQAALLALTTLAAWLVPASLSRWGPKHGARVEDAAAGRDDAAGSPSASGLRRSLSARTARAGGLREDLLALARCRPLRHLVIVSALLLGSHAMQDAFAVISWTEAGVSPRMASVLWSESVLAELLVFLVAGPALLSRLAPAGAIALAAGAGVVRWTVMALSPGTLLLALVQPLHGLTFALFHLAAMRVIARAAPPRLEATALAVYGTVGVGSASAVFTLVAGALYMSVGAAGFWVMTLLCVGALLFTWPLRERALVRASAADGSAPTDRRAPGAPKAEDEQEPQARAS